MRLSVQPSGVFNQSGYHERVPGAPKGNKNKFNFFSFAGKELELDAQPMDVCVKLYQIFLLNKNLLSTRSSLSMKSNTYAFSSDASYLRSDVFNICIPEHYSIRDILKREYGFDFFSCDSKERLLLFSKSKLSLGRCVEHLRKLDVLT